MVNDPQRDKFAMIPEALLVGQIPGMELGSRVHAGCVCLYAYLDLEQGAHGRPAKNLTRIAEKLGYQPRTVRGWALILERAGFIEIERPEIGAWRLSVVGNPARVGFEQSPMQAASRKDKPKDGKKRWGHRGNRGPERKGAPGARSSRADDAEPGARSSRPDAQPPPREERTMDPRRTQDEPTDAPREERAPVQVYQGGVCRSDFDKEFVKLALDPQRTIDSEYQLFEKRSMQAPWETMDFAEFRSAAAQLRKCREVASR